MSNLKWRYGKIRSLRKAESRKKPTVKKSRDTVPLTEDQVLDYTTTEIPFMYSHKRIARP
jgi:hypothetical protein